MNGRRRGRTALRAWATLALALAVVPARAQSTSEPHTLHLAGVTSDGRLWHTVRFPNGVWLPFGDVETQTGDAGAFVDVEVQLMGAGASAALHLCAVSSDGRLLHAARWPDGSWTGLGDVEGQAGERGRFVSVALASVSNELHVVGVTSDGRLWHTIRALSGGWTSFGDVKAEACDPGAFTRVSATALPNVLSGQVELYLCGVTADGRLYQSVRHTAYWLPFSRFLASAGGSFADIDCAYGTAPEAALHVWGASTDGFPWYSRHPLTWFRSPVADPGAATPGRFARMATTVSVDAAGRGVAQAAAVTPSGNLFHRLGPVNWTPFEFVDAGGTRPGPFVSVSIDAVSR